MRVEVGRDRDRRPARRCRARRRSRHACGSCLRDGSGSQSLHRRSHATPQPTWTRGTMGVAAPPSWGMDGRPPRAHDCHREEQEAHCRHRRGGRHRPGGIGHSATAAITFTQPENTVSTSRFDLDFSNSTSNIERVIGFTWAGLAGNLVREGGGSGCGSPSEFWGQSYGDADGQGPGPVVIGHVRHLVAGWLADRRAQLVVADRHALARPFRLPCAPATRSSTRAPRRT